MRTRTRVAITLTALAPETGLVVGTPGAIATVW